MMLRPHILIGWMTTALGLAVLAAVLWMAWANPASPYVGFLKSGGVLLLLVLPYVGFSVARGSRKAQTGLGVFWLIVAALFALGAARDFMTPGIPASEASYSALVALVGMALGAPLLFAAK